MANNLPSSVFSEEIKPGSSVVSVKPDFKFKEYEYRQEHGNKFALITLNDTKQASDPKIKANSAKFSVYIGNGLEPYKSSDGKQIATFDVQDDNQPTIAAQFHVTSLTNISTKNLLKTFKIPGEDLKNVSAIKGKADAIQLHANQMVIINAGAVSKNSLGRKTSVPGGVHIYAGDRDSENSEPSQPMVLGNNLKAAIDQINERLHSLSSIMTEMNTEIMLMRTGLVMHVHPPFAPPSPDLAAQFIPRFLTSDLLRTLNSYVGIINHKLERINRTTPLTSKKILSTHNTVN